MLSKKYPFVKQEALKDCGVACLSMIIQYYRGYMKMDLLRDLTKTNKQGVNAYHLIRAATEIGFEASGVKATLDQLNKDNLVLPCIANVTIDGKYKHYIVIYKIDYHQKRMMIADPAVGIKTITFREFNQIWNQVLLILYPIKSLPQNQHHSITRFTIKLLLGHKKIMINIIILSLFVTGFTIASSFFLQWMLGSINWHNPEVQMTWIFIIFMTIYVLKIVSEFMRNKLLIYLNLKIDLLLTMDTFKNIVALPYHYYRNRTTGEILSRVFDLGTIRQMISKFALALFIDGLLTTIALIFLYNINQTLCLLAIIIFMLYILIIYMFKQSFTYYINAVQQNKATVSSSLIETINGFETLKGLNISKQFLSQMEDKYHKLLKIIFKFDHLCNLQYLVKELVGSLGLVIIMTMGTLFVIRGQMTIGNLLTFNALLFYFLEPVRSLVDLDTNIKEAKSALDRILDLKSSEQELGITNPHLKGSLVIKNLTYGYQEGVNLLDNISFKIKSGEKAMITGSSGSGKSTIFKLLKKYYPVSRQMIYFDDIDINDLKMDSLNQSITYVAQNEILFNDTLLNNIKLNRSFSQSKLMNILKICRIEAIIKNDPAGYHLLIEENGFNLSGGEGQRIVLARSLVKNSSIILLDERMSQMDVNLERQILKDLFKYYPQKTIILISHRLDNLDLFNHLIEINDGKVTKDVIKNE